MLIVSEKTEAGKDVSIQIPRSTSDALNDFCDRHGMLKRAALKKIVEWFVDQPSLVQRVVLGVEMDVSRAYATALRQMAGKIETAGHGMRVAAADDVPQDPKDVPKGKYKK